jgi:hypothetical protein
MFRASFRRLLTTAVLATAGSWSTPATAQFFGGALGGNCGCSGQPITPYAAPIVSGGMMQSPVAYGNPCGCAVMQPQVVCQPVATYQPVTQVVEREVPVVEYKTVQKPTKQAKVVTVMEDRDVTTYRTVTEARTVSVPSYDYQQVTECQPVTVNQSYWRTVYQPVPKCSPCQYDQRPGLLGEFNRMGYALRNSLTPNTIARREFVPNVAQYAVPQTRTVAVPTTRQVTYNVARLEPVVEKRQVAVQKVIWEDTTYTAYEPVTTMRKVAVTETRMALVPYGESGVATAFGIPSSGTATAAQPTPAGTQTADSPEKGSTRLNSLPSQAAPVLNPTYQQQAPAANPAPAIDDNRPIALRSGNSVIKNAGWKAHTPKANETPLVSPNEVSVAAK